MSEEVIATFTDEEMVEWANANLERVRELDAEVERLRDALYEIAYMDPMRRIQGDAQKVAKRALDEK
jgi:hypothetical protein